MTDWFWNRLNFFLGWVAIAVLFGLMIFLANIEVKDMDLWLHLATGNYILEHFQIPAVDIFSFTRAGQAWINHEWLFQVIAAYIYNLAGHNGLISLQVFLVSITFLILFFLGYEKDRQLAPILSLLLVLLVYQLRFTHRPDLFSLLFFVLYFYILTTRLKDQSCLWMVFVLQVMWTNIHGFFVLGPLLIFIGIAGESVKRFVPLPYEWNQTGRLGQDDLRRLILLFFISLFATVFNPAFLKGALYPFHILLSLGGESKIFFSYITELLRPVTVQSMFSFQQYPFYKILIVISAWSFWVNRRKMDMGAFLFWLVFLIFSLNASRNVVYFSFAAYLVIIMNIQPMAVGDIFPVQMTEKVQNVISIGCKIFIIIWMFQYIEASALRGYYDFDTYQRKSEYGGISQRNFPYKAVTFLQDNNIKGNFLNDFNSGAYLIGKVYPDIKIFIDGRTELYGSEFFLNYHELWEGDERLLKEILSAHDISGAILNFSYSVPAGKLLKYFYSQKDWVLVYFDFDAMVFLKKIQKNEAVINRHAINLENRTVPKENLLKIGSQNVTPYRYMKRAEALFKLNFLDASFAEAQEALRIAPQYVLPYQLIAKVYLEKQQYAKAFEFARKTKLMDPGDLQARYMMAKAAYYLDDLILAEQQCLKVLSRNPGNAKTSYLLALVYARAGQNEKAWESFQQAHRLSPDATEEILLVAHEFLRKLEYQRVIKILELAAGQENASEDVAYTLGVAYERIGKRDKARELYLKALKLNPDNQDYKKAVEGLSI